jgi:effector-binding domain-containing protein
MLDTPQLTSTTDQLTAVIHLQIAKDQIQHVMGPGITELMATVGAQGIGPTGPWFTHHFRIDAQGWDFEICVPVSAPVTPTGRVAPGRWPAMRVARTVYRGPYEGLGSAWPELDRWIAAHGHQPAQDLFEVYVAGPETGADPAKWQTQLIRPLVG